MRVVVAPDSFGGALDSVHAADAIADGWSGVRGDDELIRRPMADGGEGTLRAIRAALLDDAELRTAAALDPLGRPLSAEWLVLEGGRAAFVELAAASGLAMLRPEERDPRRTTTRGTGMLVRAALDAGVDRITIGVGGSATNDGGTGLLAALGMRFLDAEGHELPEGGAALAGLERVDASGLDPRLASVELVIATDVTNPLCGPHGASAVYGPQKGADPAAVAELDASLGRLAAVVAAMNGRRVADVPGSGAAGGTVFGLLAFTHGVLRPGFEVVAEVIGLGEALATSDLVITGEGRADASTLSGKTAAGVLALVGGTPVVLLCGALGEGAAALDDAGFALVQPIADRPMSLDDAMRSTQALLGAAAARLARTISLGAALASR
ncbi:MAG: glycerate kinase [Candidatus Limnocylindria bacterium]